LFNDFQAQRLALIRKLPYFIAVDNGITMIPVPLYDFVRPRSKAGDNNNWTGPTMKSSYANKLISSQYVSKKLALPLQFFQESSLHGLKFIGQPKRHPIER